MLENDGGFGQDGPIGDRPGRSAPRVRKPFFFCRPPTSKRGERDGEPIDAGLIPVGRCGGALSAAVEFWRRAGKRGRRHPEAWRRNRSLRCVKATLRIMIFADSEYEATGCGSPERFRGKSAKPIFGAIGGLTKTRERSLGHLSGRPMPCSRQLPRRAGRADLNR